MKEGRSIWVIIFSGHFCSWGRVHNFWFTDEEKAAAFLESVKNYPNAHDISFMRLQVNVAAEYDGIVEEGKIEVTDSFEHEESKIDMDTIYVVCFHVGERAHNFIFNDKEQEAARMESVMNYPELLDLRRKELQAKVAKYDMLLKKEK